MLSVLPTCWRRVAKERGVRHVSDTIESVQLDESGAIAGLVTRANGVVKGALYIDCTGLRAKLIGAALGQPFRSCRNSLFTDRAVTCQVPHDGPASPIASYTIATGHEAGWTWDIGLNNRRGVGYVYSRPHSDDERAEKVLRAHIGAAAADKPVRLLKFEAGYRERQWVRNCWRRRVGGGILRAAGVHRSHVDRGGGRPDRGILSVEYRFRRAFPALQRPDGQALWQDREFPEDALLPERAYRALLAR